MKKGDTFSARDWRGIVRNWYVLEIEQDETHGELAQCCRYYHRNAKWIKDPKTKKQVMRPIEYFEANETIIKK
jgi:hypothetical protein